MTRLLATSLLVCVSSCSDINHNNHGTSVMSFNVLYDASDNASSITAIQNANPDILCLRELTPTFSKLFRKRLSKQYPHTVFKTRNGTWGAGIASKFPIRNAKYFPVKPHRLPALEAKLRTREGDILLSCLHLFPPFGRHKQADSYLETKHKNELLRQNQAKYLMQRYKNTTLPIILLGDLNEGNNALAVQEFKNHGFKLACEQAKIEDCGPTYPGATMIWLAIVEIDHILGKGVSFHSASVLKQGGSDHYPVMASFKLNTKVNSR